MPNTGRLEAVRLPTLWLDHLWVGKLRHWHLCHPCIALDLAIQFKHIWVQVLLGSSGPHCRKWADDHHSRPSPPLIPTIIDFRVIYLVSSPVWWEAETNNSPCSGITPTALICGWLWPKPAFLLGHFRVGEVHHWHFFHLSKALDLAVQFKL